MTCENGAAYQGEAQPATHGYNTMPDAKQLSDDENIDIKTEESTLKQKCSNCCYVMFPSGFWSEIKSMFHITWPIVLTQICQMIIGPISLIFCGHLGDAIKLDGAALAISMINATCIAVGQGLGTACDTFFSQTFGSKNKKLVGIYLQKAIFVFLLVLLGCYTVHINMGVILVALAVFIFFLALLPFAAFHINLGTFLVLVGQPPEAARLAGNYMLIFMPGALSFFMYIILAKYIQNQNIVVPNVVIGIIANAANAIFHYVFLYQLDWGTNGSAIAQAIAYFLMFILTLMYILISKCYTETWDGWTWDCLQDWGKFVRLAVPGMLMLCMEWWGFEIGVFLTGLLGTTELGAQSVLLQLDSIWFQVPLGIQIASAIRIGQYLGAGNAPGAKTVARLALLLIVLLSLVAVGIFIGFQYQLPYLFTNIYEVAQLTGDLLPIVTIYVFFDGVAAACKGVLYGTGRQIYGAVLLFVSYYILALPMGIPLMFLTDLKNAGYWWALALNLVIQATVLTIIIFRTKWDEQVSKAQERAGLIGEDIESSSEDISEKTSLLGKPRRSIHERRGSRLLSSSLTLAEIQVLIEDDNRLSKTQLVVRRLLAAVVMIGIFVVGVLVRVYVPLPEPNSDLISTTALPMYNATFNATLSEDFLF